MVIVCTMVGRHVDTNESDRIAATEAALLETLKARSKEYKVPCIHTILNLCMC